MNQYGIEQISNESVLESHENIILMVLILVFVVLLNQLLQKFVICELRSLIFLFRIHSTEFLYIILSVQQRLPRISLVMMALDLDRLQEDEIIL